MKHKKCIIHKMTATFIIHTLITLTVSFGLAEASYIVINNINNEKERKELYDSTHQYAQRMQESITSKMYLVDTLEVMLELADFDIETFNEWAPTVYKSAEGVEAVQLAPDGVVQCTYPLKGNESILGHDLLKDKSRVNGAMKAIEDKQLTIVGPVILKQNGKLALVGRKPLFINKDDQESFWGFTIVVIGLDEFIAETLQEVHAKGYAYRIIGDNPDDRSCRIIYSSSDKIEKWDAKYPFIVPNGNWFLELAKEDVSGEHKDWTRGTLHLIGVILTIIWSYQHYRMIKQAKLIENLNTELNTLSYTDELTGLINRRGCVKALKMAMNEADHHHEPLTLAIMDIDKFKSINDTYGHDAGDHALKQIAEHYNNNIQGKWLLGRWGGDEFIAIFKETHKLQAYASMKVFINGVNDNQIHQYMEMKLTLSVGITEYNGGTMDSFIMRADQALYKAKVAGRDRIELN